MLNKILHFTIKFLDLETMNQLRMALKDMKLAKHYFESVFYNYATCMRVHNKYESTTY